MTKEEFRRWIAKHERIHPHAGWKKLREDGEVARVLFDQWHQKLTRSRISYDLACRISEDMIGEAPKYPEDHIGEVVKRGTARLIQEAKDRIHAEEAEKQRLNHRLDEAVAEWEPSFDTLAPDEKRQILDEVLGENPVLKGLFAKYPALAKRACILRFADLEHVDIR